MYKTIFGQLKFICFIRTNKFQLSEEEGAFNMVKQRWLSGTDPNWRLPFNSVVARYCFSFKNITYRGKKRKNKNRFTNFRVNLGLWFLPKKLWFSRFLRKRAYLLFFYFLNELAWLNKTKKLQKNKYLQHTC